MLATFVGQVVSLWATFYFKYLFWIDNLKKGASWFQIWTKQQLLESGYVFKYL